MSLCKQRRLYFTTLNSTIMKKFFVFAAVAIVALTACENGMDEQNVPVMNQNDEQTEVTLTFSPYDMSAMTRGTARRAATSISGLVTKLDVWITEGTNTIDVHQSSTDDDFGTVSVSLNRLKTYTLVAVAHKASGAATLTDGVIAFPDEKVTHAMIYQTTFSPGTTASLNCPMTRIVGMLRFEIADQVPTDAYTMRFELGESFTRWNVTSSVGANTIERTTTFNGFSRASDGTAAFTVYVIPTNLTDTDHMDITVRALKENGDELESKTFADVPIKAGYKTTYHGEFFTTKGSSAGFTVNDWSEFDTVEY